ncbi:uncharacterized protein LOC134820076 [Bolinopsis microptera]|uniref:uncharacterized protein LOC134820076 n=1 Tax=Bolinopsis microptera TaxID=2820187 RepID=UPI003079B8E6
MPHAYTVNDNSQSCFIVEKMMSALIGAVGVGVAAVAQLIITILILGGKADKTWAGIFYTLLFAIATTLLVFRLGQICCGGVASFYTENSKIIRISTISLGLVACIGTLVLLSLHIKDLINTTGHVNDFYESLSGMSPSQNRTNILNDTFVVDIDYEVKINYKIYLDLPYGVIILYTDMYWAMIVLGAIALPGHVVNTAIACFCNGDNK